jgi:hypothetical protein
LKLPVLAFPDLENTDVEVVGLEAESESEDELSSASVVMGRYFLFRVRRIHGKRRE